MDDENMNVIRAVDTSHMLTDQDLEAIKEISRYWQAGKLVVVVIIALGATAAAMLSAMDFWGKIK